MNDPDPRPERRAVRLALSLLLGRAGPESLHAADMTALGLDPYRRPPADLVMECAEEILLDAICGPEAPVRGG